jgi:hypothetical protein
MALAFGLAGCSSGGASQPDLAANETSSGGATYDSSSAPSVEGINFDVQNLVVRLATGHSISDLSLIAPDGTLYTSASVATGQTTVPMQILDVDLMSGGYTHYEPGIHELVLETGSGQESVSIPLEPDLEIVDVGPVENPESPVEYGQLVVTVTNRGTGPTWVYDVAFEDAPNFAANDPLGDNPGVSRLSGIEGPEDLIVIPGSEGHYSSTDVPLLLPDSSEGICASETTTFSLSVGVAQGTPINTRISATADGEPVGDGIRGGVTCSNLSVMIDRNES